MEHPPPREAQRYAVYVRRRGTRRRRIETIMTAFPDEVVRDPDHQVLGCFPVPRISVEAASWTR